MHHQRKKAAVEKYGALKSAGASREEIVGAIGQDEKEYNTDEIQVVLAELFNEEPPVEEPALAKLHYKEYEVKITNGSVEKLKVVRPCVKITDEQADVLNAGIQSGGNTYAKMYFKD